jgi:ubiquinol-cytochrome c reductase subunit 6
MGFFDVIAAALPWSDAEAEAVKGGASTESTPANDSEGGKEGGDAKVSFLRFMLYVFYSI